MQYNQRQHKSVLCPVLPFSQLTAGPSNIQVYVQCNVSLMLDVLLMDNMVSHSEYCCGYCHDQVESPSAFWHADSLPQTAVRG